MPADRLFNRQFALLFSAEIILQVGLYCIRPIVSSFAVALGASLALAGLLSGLLSAVALFTRPFCGATSDRYDKRMLLAASAVLLVVSSFGCAFTNSLLVLGVFEAIRGVAFTFKSALVVALAALLTPSDKIGAGLGYISLGFTVPGAIGPMLSSFLVEQFGYAACYCTSGVLSAVGLAILLMLKPPESTKACRTTPDKAPHRQSPVSFIRQFIYVPAMPYSVIAGILGCAYGTPLALLFLIESTGYLENASLYFALYTLVVLFSRIIGGKLCDQHGVIVALPAICVAFLGAIPLALDGSTFNLCLCAVAMGAGQGPAYSILLAESMRSAPAEEMGKASNTFYLSLDLGMGLCPLVGGMLLNAFGCSSVFFADVAYILVSLVLCILLVALKRREATRR